MRLASRLDMTTTSLNANSVTKSLSTIVQRVAESLHLNGAARREPGAPVRATDLLRLFGLTPGGEFVLPDEWLRSLTASRREQ